MALKKSFFEKYLSKRVLELTIFGFGAKYHNSVNFKNPFLRIGKANFYQAIKFSTPALTLLTLLSK